MITFTKDLILNRDNLKIVIEEMLDKIIAPDTADGYGCDNMTSIIITLKDKSKF